MITGPGGDGGGRGGRGGPSSLADEAVSLIDVSEAIATANSLQAHARHLLSNATGGDVVEVQPGGAVIAVTTDPQSYTSLGEGADVGGGANVRAPAFWQGSHPGSTAAGTGTSTGTGAGTGIGTELTAILIPAPPPLASPPGRATLASSLISLGAPPPPAGSAAAELSVPVQVLLVLSPPPPPKDAPTNNHTHAAAAHTNFSCREYGLFDSSSEDPQACVAGCCRAASCQCRHGFMGERCDLELRCALVPPGEAALSLDGECEPVSHDTDAGLVVCSCKQLGMVGAVLMQLTPATNTPFNAASIRHVAAQLGARSQATLIGCLLGLLGLLFALARRSDLRLLYCDQKLLPRFLAPMAPYSWADELACNLLTRSCVLRCLFVWPGFTLYTHSQLLVVLLNSLATNALAVALFLGRGAENCTAAAAALAVVSICLASVLASAARLLFRWANLRDDARFRTFYRHHKTLKTAARRAKLYDGTDDRDGAEPSRVTYLSAAEATRPATSFSEAEGSSIALAFQRRPATALDHTTPGRAWLSLGARGDAAPEHPRRSLLSQKSGSQKTARPLRAQVKPNDLDDGRAGPPTSDFSLAAKVLASSATIDASRRGTSADTSRRGTSVETSRRTIDTSRSSVKAELSSSWVSQRTSQPRPSAAWKPSPPPSPPHPSKVATHVASCGLVRVELGGEGSRKGSRKGSSAGSCEHDCLGSVADEAWPPPRPKLIGGGGPSVAGEAYLLKRLGIAHGGSRLGTGRHLLSSQSHGSLSEGSGNTMPTHSGKHGSHSSSQGSELSSSEPLELTLMAEQVAVAESTGRLGIVLAASGKGDGECGGGEGGGGEAGGAPDARASEEMADLPHVILPSSTPVFVPALSIRALDLGSRCVRMRLERESLPPAWRERPMLHEALASAAVVMSHTAPRRLRCAVGPRESIAWMLNLTLLVTASGWLVYTFLARTLLPSNLQASALDDDEWSDAFTHAFLLASLQSLLLVDAIKIGCLTATASGGLLDTVLRRTHTKALRKPLRRLYKFFDVLL